MEEKPPEPSKEEANICDKKSCEEKKEEAKNVTIEALPLEYCCL